MSREIRHEATRIGGEKVTTDNVVEVRYPYTNEVIALSPQAQPNMPARRLISPQVIHRS